MSEATSIVEQLRRGTYWSESENRHVSPGEPGWRVEEFADITIKHGVVRSFRRMSEVVSVKSEQMRWRGNQEAAELLAYFAEALTDELEPQGCVPPELEPEPEPERDGDDAAVSVLVTPQAAIPDEKLPEKICHSARDILLAFFELGFPPGAVVAVAEVLLEYLREFHDSSGRDIFDRIVAHGRCLAAEAKKSHRLEITMRGKLVHLQVVSTT